MRVLVEILPNNRFWSQTQQLASPSEKSWIRYWIIYDNSHIESTDTKGRRKKKRSQNRSQEKKTGKEKRRCHSHFAIEHFRFSSEEIAGEFYSTSVRAAKNPPSATSARNVGLRSARVLGCQSLKGPTFAFHYQTQFTFFSFNHFWRDK